MKPIPTYYDLHRSTEPELSSKIPTRAGTLDWESYTRVLDLLARIAKAMADGQARDGAGDEAPGSGSDEEEYPAPSASRTDVAGVIAAVQQ